MHADVHNPTVSRVNRFEAEGFSVIELKDETGSDITLFLDLELAGWDTIVDAVSRLRARNKDLSGA